MDPYRLRLLRELADRGSVRAVAAALQVSPSSVSQHLSALESTVGTKLTERDGQRLGLTQAGRALATAAVSVERALATAESAVEQFLASNSAPVRVSAFHSAALAFFGPLLKSRLPADPPIHLGDEDVAWNEFPQLTADYDLVIAHRLPHEAEWPGDWITATRVLTEPIDVVMRQGHPLARRQTLTSADLAGHDWVAVHGGFPLRGVLDQIAGSAGEPSNVVHEVNDFSVTAAVVCASDALAIMPRIAGLHLESSIERRTIQGLRMQRNIEVLARPANLERAAVRRTLELIHRVARDYVVRNHT